MMFTWVECAVAGIRGRGQCHDVHLSLIHVADEIILSYSYPSQFVEGHANEGFENEG